MFTVRPRSWHSLLLLGAVACLEEITAPGACPDFCPAAQIRVVDTVMTGIIVRDSSFRGYVTAPSAAQMQLATSPTGALESRGVVLFQSFRDSLLDTGQLRPVVAVDSIQVEVLVRRRAMDVSDLEVVLHRLPVSIDSLVTFADVDAFFHDTTIVGAIAIPDSVTSGRVSTVLAPEALPISEDDSLTVALGFSLRASQPTYADLGTIEAAEGPVITRFVKIDSVGGELAERTDAVGSRLDTFVFTEAPDPDNNALVAGGAPSARALLRVALPPKIVDSSSVVRASLLLVPSEPVRGAPGDSVRVVVEALSADFGPKSPIVPALLDTTEVGNIFVPVGSTDTLRIDVTHIVVPWKSNPNLPRSFMLRIRPEGGSPAELRFGSSSRQNGAPALHVSYVPPTFGAQP